MNEKRRRKYNLGEEGLQKLAGEMRVAGLDHYLEFMEWFEEQCIIDGDGYATHIPLNSLDEQDHLSEEEALTVVCAMMYGTMWEQKEPCHIVRENLSDEELERLRTGRK